MNPWKWLIPILGGMATGAKIDVATFVNSRKEDPTVQFDWGLFAARLADGAMGGFLVAAGLSVVPEG